MSTIKQGSQNTVEPLLRGPLLSNPLLSGPLLSGQLLFGSQRPNFCKKLSAIHCNKNLNSTATSIKRPQSACCPKGVFVLFYTPIKWQVRGILVYYIRLINISNSVLDGATNKSVLNIERS